MKAEKRGGGSGFSIGGHSEFKLIEKAKNGSKEAFEELMRNYMEVIYNYICSHVSATEAARDILQETMLSIWQCLKSFDGNSSLKTWCISITRRKIADHYRKVYKDDSMSLEDLQEILKAENDFECVYDKLAVENALTILDKTEREIVFLVFNAQLSYNEVSKIMNIPVGTIKSRMSGIKAKLKKRLGKGEWT